MTWTIVFFCLQRCKWELPDQHIDNGILPPELFYNILIISTVRRHEMSKVTKLVYKAKFLISEPNSCWVPPCDCIGRASTQTVFVMLHTISWGSAYARHTLVTWPLLRLSMIYCCALGLLSQICVTCRGDGSWFQSPCLVVSGQDASGPWDDCIRSRWLRSTSATQIWVWLLRNAGF